MAEFITARHSYNAGDLITILPGLRHYYKETGKKTLIYQRLNLPAFYYEGATHPIQHEGQNVCMNEKMFNDMFALISAQEYIEGFKVWQGEEFQLDFDLSRDRKFVPMPYGDIHHWPWFTMPQLACNLSEPWLFVLEPPELKKEHKDLIIINRTARYQNPYISYHFLKEVDSKNLMFIGTEEERLDFNKRWGLRAFGFGGLRDLWKVAMAIKSCKLFIGNQSLCWHIANAMQVPRILEVCPQFPNTLPTGKNGYAFIYQEALQYYFNKLA